jgi:hypothetical protein
MRHPAWVDHPLLFWVGYVGSGYICSLRLRPPSTLNRRRGAGLAFPAFQPGVEISAADDHDPFLLGGIADQLVDGPAALAEQFGEVLAVQAGEPRGLRRG